MTHRRHPLARPSGLVLRLAVGAATAAILLILILPVASVLLHAPIGDLLYRLRQPAVVDALRLSVLTSMAAAAMVIVLGLPLAYLLATRTFPGKRVLEVLIDLPMVLPPTVAGFALLLAFGRSGLAGRALEPFGFTIPFTTMGVVLAQVFMAAPFFIGPARAGFLAVSPGYLDAAATLRASEARTFFRVMLPLARPALLTGAAMCWARSLGEFGATITFAGNLPGVTQTMPLAVYVALQTDLDAAVTMSVLLVLVSFTLLLALRASPLSFPIGRDRAASWRR